MSVAAEFVARDDVSGRDLFLLAVDDVAAVPATMRLSSPRFVCLVIYDARDAGAGQLAALARKLIDSGAVYVCAWGPGCSNVEVAVDLEDIGPNPPRVLDRVIMTTSHSDEPLEEAIWFALNCAWPDDAYEAGCDSMLAMVIGNSGWTQEVRAAISDPRTFTTRVAAKEP